MVEAYGKNTSSIKTCKVWFREFKRVDFNVKDSECFGRPLKFEDEELQDLLDDDSTQIQRQLTKTGLLELNSTQTQKQLT